MASTTDLLWYTSTAAACYITIPAIARLVRSQILVPKFTAIHDLDEAGTPRNRKLSGDAVICGGSVAGLLAATVAADHYKSVLVIESEEWLMNSGREFPAEDKIRVSPDGIPVHANPRSRVKQYTSAHAFMPMCFRTLRKLFPSYDEEIQRLDAKELFHDPNFHFDGLPLGVYSDDGPNNTILYISREILEILLRRLVTKDRPNVRFVEGTVTSIQKAPDGRTINELYWRTSNGSIMTSYNPSLVIDATGGTQAGLKWLSKAGFNIPASIRAQYQVPLHYVTTVLRVPSHLRAKIPLEKAWDDTGFIYTYLPDLKKETGFFTMGIVDRYKILICCGGWGSLPRPHSVEEIRQYICGTLPQKPINPRLFELLDFLEENMSELNPTYTDASQNACSYIQYHRLAAGDLPSNFVAIGDSVMQLNPIFAQGITKATVDALTLDSVLRNTNESDISSLPSRFFKSQASRLDFAWNSTKDSDYGLSFTKPIDGEDRSVGWFSRWYAGYAMKLALKNPSVADILANARGFAAPHTDLMSPSILMNVLWMWLTNQ